MTLWRTFHRSRAPIRYSMGFAVFVRIFVPSAAPLYCHPSSPCTAVSALHASVVALADGTLRLRFVLRGERHALRIPAVLGDGFADGLWQHTCFEAFVCTANTQAYREFNFSPSGQWAAYAFTDYRRRDERWIPCAAPSLQLRVTNEGLELEATVPAALLPPSPVQIGLTAVIEMADASLSYWALNHPGERPDFHLAAGFTVSLAPHTELL